MAGLGVPIDALWCGELALFALGAAIELQATKTEKTFPRGQISGIKSLLLPGPRAFVLHKLVVPVAPFSRAIREQGGSRALAIKTQEQDKSAISHGRLSENAHDLETKVEIVKEIKPS